MAGVAGLERKSEEEGLSGPGRVPGYQPRHGPGGPEQRDVQVEMRGGILEMKIKINSDIWKEYLSMPGREAR